MLVSDTCNCYWLLISCGYELFLESLCSDYEHLCPSFFYCFFEITSVL